MIYVVPGHQMRLRGSNKHHPSERNQHRQLALNFPSKELGDILGAQSHYFSNFLRNRLVVSEACGIDDPYI